ncbi:glycosyl hydrolase [Nocardioides insulae]|uniref:glycosyl hydrolase n=1 Tax=Nocardioides insulae TaxID=394734 RepID=UPI0004064DDD|nr:glycosyl hydrolase [Nocardioides insulae]
MTTPATPTTPALPVRRRTLFGGAAVAAGFALLPHDPAAAMPARGQGPGHGLLPDALVRGFRSPGTATAAGFRWWWPHGAVDPVEVAREVDQIAAAGFGVLEIADVTHSLRARDIEIDLGTHGWGTKAWRDGVKAALRQGHRREVRIDITVGPSWPAAVSTITPDDEAACTELAHGSVDVAAGETYQGAVPEPLVGAEEASTVRTLEAVHAFRVAEVTTRETKLIQASFLDLTDQVADGAISWTAPDQGAWVLLSYWRRGSAQEPEAGPHTDPRSYVVDHFSMAGVQAVIDLWNDQVLDGEMRSLLRRAGGYLFEDSLEIETDATIWTPRMLAEFEQRIGYDLRPYLPAVVERDEKYPYSFTDVDPGHVRDDYNQVLSDLYRDHHLVPLQRFAKTLGMGIRIQPYGLETDTLEHAGIVDVPETESLGFKNLDDYRILAGGRDMAGHTLLSCEAACYFGAAYQTTWDRALQTLNSIFVAGVNQAVLHGFAYAEAPEVTWPGFAAFSPYYNGAIGYGEAWGPRTPQWRHMPDIAAYLARTQLVLQTGTPKYDVGFLRAKGWASTGIGPAWITNNGTKYGWSHGFLTAPALEQPRAVVRRGVLAPEGPAYKVLVLENDFFRGQERAIALDTARKVLAYGRAGLPIVLVGDWSTVVPVGLAENDDVDELRSVIGQVAALSTTRQSLDKEKVGDALADLGIVRDVEHEDSTVQHVRRVEGDTDLYYLANAKHAENRRLSRVTQDVWLTATSARAVPYRLNAWTGEIEPLALYERSGDRIRVSVDLHPGQSTVIALAAPRPGNRVWATATTGEAVRSEGGRLLVRADTAGVVTTTLPGGRTVRTTVDRVREPIDLASWDLELEDWQPRGESATETVRPVRWKHLDALVPWSEVPGIEDVAGVGRYRTTVDLGRDWGKGDGARLELGAVSDTFRVRVNGRDLPPCDRLDTTVDLGAHLVRGRNQIEVEVTSPLINRLRTVTPDVYGAAARAEQGLLGPVRLVPYVDAQVGH